MAWPTESSAVNAQAHGALIAGPPMRSMVLLPQRGIFVSAPTLTFIPHEHYVLCTATCNDLSGRIYYHWFKDGEYLAVTRSNTYTIYMEIGEQADIQVKCSNQSAEPPAPAGWPRYRTLFWTRSTDEDVKQYLIDQNKDGAGWVEAGRVWDVATQWSYEWRSGRLVDLSTYQWRVVPIDQAGNEGTAITLDSIKIVGSPDAPNYTISWDDGTTKVTWAAA